MEKSVAQHGVMSACELLNVASQISEKKLEFCTCRLILYFGTNGGPAGPVMGRSSMSSLHPTVKRLHLVHSCYILNSVSQVCVCLCSRLTHTVGVEVVCPKSSLLSCFQSINKLMSNSIFENISEGI